MPTSTTSITTKNPNRHIKRLCKHFAHTVNAVYSGSGGYVDFSPGTCRMDATGDTLIFNIDADDQDRLQVLQKIISSHMDRFAKDEAFNWHWE